MGVLVVGKLIITLDMILLVGEFWIKEYNTIAKKLGLSIHQLNPIMIATMILKLFQCIKSF